MLCTGERHPCYAREGGGHLGGVREARGEPPQRAEGRG